MRSIFYLVTTPSIIVLVVFQSLLPLPINGDTKVNNAGSSSHVNSINKLTTKVTLTDQTKVNKTLPVFYRAATDPCRYSICGRYGVCKVIAGRSNCTCIEDPSANPIFGCRAPAAANCEATKTCNDSCSGPNCPSLDVKFCQYSFQCPSNLTCQDHKCVQTCPEFCGTNALCEVRQNEPYCACPVGFYGDPFLSCRQDTIALFGSKEIRAQPASSHEPSPTPSHPPSPTPSHAPSPTPSLAPVTVETDICESNPCGPHKHCILMDGMESFTCQEDINANLPISHQSECMTNYDCPNNRTCVNYNCKESELKVGECTVSNDCPANKNCVVNKCIDCSKACGSNAICQLRDHISVCECPEGFEGDPSVSCNFMTTTISPSKEDETDPCIPNPCGPNSVCISSDFVATCRCLENFQRDPKILSGRCLEVTTENVNAVGQNGTKTHADPCNPSPCGLNGICTTSSPGSAICTCLPKFQGDPYAGCVRTEFQKAENCTSQNGICEAGLCKYKYAEDSNSSNQHQTQNSVESTSEAFGLTEQP